jgi:hypothetical protein
MNKVIFCFFFSLAISASAQETQKPVSGKIGPRSLFIIDSQRVKASDIAKYSPDSVTTVVVIFDTSAIRLYGDSAKNGVVIVETRSFARRKFISFFRKSSPQYDSLFTAVGNDSGFQYIINGNLQIGNYEGNLSSITDELFEGLEILTKEQLKTKYNIIDKLFGILVHSKTPKDLYNGDKKF